MTKFLADENIPPAVVDFLRVKGFDVLGLQELGESGVSDETIMDMARREGRVLITFDKHFANILLYPPKSHHGVLRIRIHPPLLSDIIQALEQLLQKRDIATIDRTLIVLERNGFRVRR
jgi:predicted nuclease of predicted toxin-antitoxin system